MNLIELNRSLVQLRLSGMAAVMETRLLQAQSENMAPIDLISILVSDELAIDAILEEDKSRPRRQRHTAKRIFERLREEHGYTGGYTIVKDYVRQSKLGAREMFVPLSHVPGEAQADFGEALVVIAGVECEAHYLAFDLPHSDDCFVVAAKPAFVELIADRSAAMADCVIEFESSVGSKMRIQWMASTAPDWLSLFRAWRES